MAFLSKTNTVSSYFKLTALVCQENYGRDLHERITSTGCDRWSNDSPETSGRFEDAVWKDQVSLRIGFRMISMDTWKIDEMFLAERRFEPQIHFCAVK
jgi:hypothetical protein